MSGFASSFAAFKSYLRGIINYASQNTWIADIFSLLAAIFAFYHLWTFTHNRDSVLDEGAYLLKGLLYATGEFQMYQPYGPWSYHMPLVYLIPGTIQRILGPGLEAGRLFSIVLAGVTFLGLWLLVLKLRGKWWAAGVLWLFVSNPATLKTYSLAISQVLVSCMLVWMLYFVLGEDRKSWHLMLGAGLASLMIITRLNMLPVLPVILLFILWEYGPKKAALSLAAGLVPILVIHIIYWPGILQVWGWWLPRELTPFLDSWRLPTGYERFWNPKITIENQIASFFMAFRFHFTALIGAITAMILWPRGKNWRSSNEFRTSVFLIVLLGVLFLFHIWAALGKNYCVQCLTAYVAFFSPVGVMLLAMVWSNRRSRLHPILQFATILFVIVLAAGIGYSAFENIGASLLDLRIPKILADPLSMDFTPERLRKTLLQRYEMSNLEQRMWVSSLSGALVGMVIIVISLVPFSYHFLKPKVFKTEYIRHSIGYYALISFLFAGIILTPTFLLGGAPYAYDCSGDTIQSYRSAGEHLAGIIPPGSKIYWAGELSAVPLLYIPGVQIYTPQIEGSYSRFRGGDPDTLLRFGLWNEQIAQEWADEADFILIKERYYEGWLKALLESRSFDELEPSPPTVDCRKNARIHIFKRIHP